MAPDIPEINPVAFGVGLFHKEIFHHLIQVIHVGAHHAEGHWEGRTAGGERGCAAEAAEPAGHGCGLTEAEGYQERDVDEQLYQGRFQFRFFAVTYRDCCSNWQGGKKGEETNKWGGKERGVVVVGGGM